MRGDRPDIILAVRFLHKIIESFDLFENWILMAGCFGSLGLLDLAYFVDEVFIGSGLRSDILHEFPTLTTVKNISQYL